MKSKKSKNKKENKKTNKKKLWLIVTDETEEGINRTEDIESNANSTLIYATKEEAMNNFNSDSDNYIVEVEIKSIKTDRLPGEEIKLFEIALK